jgi:hypothetical protein
MVGRPLLDPRRGAALLRVLGAVVALLGLLGPSFHVCGFACGECGQVGLSGQTVAAIAGIHPPWTYAVEIPLAALLVFLQGAAVATLLGADLPAGLLIAELAVAIFSLAAVVSLDVVAAARLPADACCDLPSGGPLQSVVLAPAGYVVVALGAAVALKQRPDASR